MKRVIITLLAGITVLSLTACGDAETGTDVANDGISKSNEICKPEEVQYMDVEEFLDCYEIEDLNVHNCMDFFDFKVVEDNHVNEAGEVEYETIGLTMQLKENANLHPESELYFNVFHDFASEKEINGKRIEEECYDIKNQNETVMAMSNAWQYSGVFCSFMNKNYEGNKESYHLIEKSNVRISPYEMNGIGWRLVADENLVWNAPHSDASSRGRFVAVKSDKGVFFFFEDGEYADANEQGEILMEYMTHGDKDCTMADWDLYLLF